jgi:hypothetical protein
MAIAQTKLYLAYPDDSPQSGNEVTVSRSQQQSYNNVYYHTSIYNDIFTLPESDDKFILPLGNFYKEKKVAKVTIMSALSATPQFILDLNPDGQVIKTTLFAWRLLHKNQYFYDAKGRNNVIVKSYTRNDSVLRLDTIRYVHQRKVIHDTVYDYTTIYTTIYKSGAFLNEQNKWYNKTYYMERITPYDAFHAPRFPFTNIYLKKILASNYTPDQFYFSRQFIDVGNYKFTYQDKPVSPDEKTLEIHCPELYRRQIPHYSDLPCEQFEEPRFMRTQMTCGSGMQRAAEYHQMMMNTRYTSSKNSNNLQDTCYTTYGGSKDPRYYFTYAYFE